MECKTMAEQGKPKFAFFEGKIVPIEDAKISVMTHAFNYGTGVFGGLRGYWNDDENQLFVFRPHDHFERLTQSASLLRINVPHSVPQLVEILNELLRTEGFRENVYIRPVAYKSTEMIGVRLHDVDDEITMFAMPFGRYVEKEEGLHVGFSSWRRVDDNSIPARSKVAGAYVNSALAKTDANRAGFDEALVLNSDGHISEGSAMNVFMVRNGVLVTPPITDNILEGITRRSIMEVARNEFGLTVEERSIDRTEAFIADEMFFTGSAAQVVAITKIDHRPIGSGSMGPITTKLRAFYEDVVRAKNSKYASWNVEVK